MEPGDLGMECAITRWTVPRACSLGLGSAREPSDITDVLTYDFEDYFYYLSFVLRRDVVVQHNLIIIRPDSPT